MEPRPAPQELGPKTFVPLAGGQSPQA